MLPGVGQAVNVELALQAMNITKQFSRDLLGRSLPVPDATLAVHQKALAAIAAKARQTRLQVRKAALSKAILLYWGAACPQRPPVVAPSVVVIFIYHCKLWRSYPERQLKRILTVLPPIMLAMS